MRPAEKKDLKWLNKINQEIIGLRHVETHKFSFLMDSGDKDNAIGFSKMDNFVAYTKPLIEGMDYDEIFVPDLLCYKHKLIIEYNETPVGSKNHNKRKKGHVDESTYDKNKIDYYLKAGFTVLILYDFELKQKNHYRSEDTWQTKLRNWLVLADRGEITGTVTS